MKKPIVHPAPESLTPKRIVNYIIYVPCFLLVGVGYIIGYVAGAVWCGLAMGFDSGKVGEL